jgi:hypothetical protein
MRIDIWHRLKSRRYLQNVLPHYSAVKARSRRRLSSLVGRLKLKLKLALDRRRLVSQRLLVRANWLQPVSWSQSQSVSVPCRLLVSQNARTHKLFS